MPKPTKDGGPAFPVIVEREDGGVRWTDVEPGMTLRDYFAGQALVGRGGFYADTDLGREYVAALAGQCYRIADAMLAAREASHG